ncbi:hypothetical protein [uncultured Winogradskyella sp.]|uniref:hypothetical protein n=1 Tax=uncultured Winogradskyella sp. TaxID=395353 RepID=UPI002630D9E2|nr:hypothetical protein [uncultured Winogradskyella sp.]|tara:strand:+ start:207 stop:953 length:747 start_codon:yes stop_codon:yes gene_type:complete
MLVNKIFKVVLLLLGGIYILLQGFAKEVEAAVLSAVILLLLTWFYSNKSVYRSKFFTSFLVVFTIAQVLSAIAWFTPKIMENETDYLYYITNILFVISYVLLIIKTISQLNLKVVFSELTVPIIVLIVLDVFCVSLISGTTEGSFSYYQNILEYTYNAVVMALLSFALVDYMYRNNSKSMLFLLGTIFMAFSEIIQLAYFYILSDDSLSFVYAFFLVMAFFFLYAQSQYKVTEPIAAYEDEPLEVKNS